MKWSSLLEEVSLAEILEFCGISDEDVLQILFDEGYISKEDVEALTPITVELTGEF